MMVSGLPMMVSGPPTVVCVPIYGHWPLGDGVSMEAVGQIALFWLEFRHNKYKYV